MSRICNLCFIYMFMVIIVYVQRINFSLCTMLAKTAEGLCSLLSPSVVQWDAMTLFMECTVTQIFKSLEEEVIGAMSSNDKICMGK